jgi:gentisate 1,2-dioxygenase
MGTIFRTVEFPPDSAWKGMDARKVFDELKAGHAADAHAANPGMHKTASVDYALVIKGEIWAILDKDERLMREGDVLIQRGTNHAWSNRSEENCLMMFVLCGAYPI